MTANENAKNVKTVDYIRKGITNTIINGFKLENNAPVAATLEFEGNLNDDRANAKARKANMLVTSIERKRVYYRLDRAVAMENATDKRNAKDDIQLGETGTTVHYLRLTNDKVNGIPTTVSESITFDAPMTETRAFGAARRACAFDILPYASEQNRNAKFIGRAKFFELAELVKDTTDADADADDADDADDAADADENADA